MPNFLILGAQKAGTTSIYKYLCQHPEIFMSANKEPHYFTLGDMELTPEAKRMYSHVPLTLKEYQQLFQDVQQEKAIGEASTSYLDTPRAARRIKQFLPKAKLIAVLRDPAERAQSHFTFNHKVFNEKLSTFHEVMAAEQQRLSQGLGPRFKYSGKGFYFEQLQTYFSLFNRDQIQIFLYDDFKADPLTVMQKMFHFLEVDDRFEPDMSVKYNVSGLYRNKPVEKLMRIINPLRCVLEKKLPPKLVSYLGRILMKENKFAPSLRQELIDIYREDILKLQDLLQRDLSTWLH